MHDAAYLSALSALAGSLVGGLTSGILWGIAGLVGSRRRQQRWRRVIRRSLKYECCHLPKSWRHAKNRDWRPVRLPYGAVNACSSSRAASLKSFRGSIPCPLFITSRSSWTVLFGAKYVSTVASMTFWAHAIVRADERTRILLIIA